MKSNSLIDISISPDAGIFQFLAALEIVHSAIGIVGGSPFASLLQWFGRSNVLFAVVRSVPEVQTTVAVGAMLLAWTLSEVIRYPWYATTTADFCPKWLTWLRYTMFIPLYPIGVWGEMMACYLALPYLEERKLHSIYLPNVWNFSFNYAIFTKILLCLYLFLWWQLFSMMLRQRRKKLQIPASVDHSKKDK